MTEATAKIMRFDRVWSAILAEQAALESVNDLRCDACEQVKHNLLRSKAGRLVCLDCYNITPELHYCGNHNSPVPQGVREYDHGPSPFTKKFPTPKDEK